MLADMMADLPTGHPGCLIASYCYQDRLFDQQVRELNASAVLGWRRRFRKRLDEIAARYPPRIRVDLDDLADTLSVVVDGGIILSKATRDPAPAGAPGAALPRVHPPGVSGRLTRLAGRQFLTMQSARVSFRALCKTSGN